MLGEAITKVSELAMQLEAQRVSRDLHVRVFLRLAQVHYRVPFYHFWGDGSPTGTKGTLLSSLRDLVEGKPNSGPLVPRERRD